MRRKKWDIGGRFRTRNLTFDRAGIDKLVCHAVSIERVTMVRNTISSFVPFRSYHPFPLIPMFLRICVNL